MQPINKVKKNIRQLNVSTKCKTNRKSPKFLLLPAMLVYYAYFFLMSPTAPGKQFF